MTDHFYRASWYLPKIEGKCEKVLLFHKIPGGPGVMERPAAMGKEFREGSHILTSKNYFSFVKALFTSRLILIWKKDSNYILNIFLELIETPVVNIDTQDINSKEYGAYCGLIWRFLLTKSDKEIEIFNNYQKFSKIYNKLRADKIKATCVFGTGPSIDSALEYDFEGCLSIVCNSIVRNHALMEHIKPKFICAGDVVSHFGVSLYAETFRKHLIKVLQQNDLYLFTTASFSYLLMLHYPEIKEKIIQAQQETHKPNYNLKTLFGLPALDSTLNIHMLPLAATFSDTIFVLGCDGKDPDQKKNEDFWAHSGKAQYHALVETGHICHPTFDLHRQKSTYNGYLDSVNATITQGELLGKRYISLSSSYVQPLKDREAVKLWGKSFSKIVANNDLEFERTNTINPTEADCTTGMTGPPLPFLEEISKMECIGSNFSLQGWVLSCPTVNNIVVSVDDSFNGWAMPQRRLDLAKRHPEYNSEYAGFIHFGTCDKGNPKSIKIEFFHNDKLLKRTVLEWA
jgi:hypothetical protein